MELLATRLKEYGLPPTEENARARWKGHIKEWIMDARAVLAAHVDHQFEISEADALNLADCVGNVIYGMMLELYEYYFGFVYTKDYAPGRATATAFASVRHQLHTNQGPAVLPPAADIHTIYIGDLLGLVWLQLHKIAARVPGSDLGIKYATATWNSLLQQLPDLTVVASASGVVIAEAYEDWKELKPSPSLGYFCTVLPETPPTLLADLDVHQLMQTLQVINFTFWWLDLRKDMHDLLRVFAVIYSDVIDDATLHHPLHDQVTRRAYTLLVGLDYMARRVRSTPQRKTVQPPREHYETLRLILSRMTKEIRVGGVVANECRDRMLAMMVRPWDAVMFANNDKLGNVDAQNMVPNMWQSTFGEVFGFFSRTFSEQWDDPCMGPHYRAILGTYIFDQVARTQYNIPVDFRAMYVAFEDVSKCNEPWTVPQARLPARFAVCHDEPRNAPMFVCRGNILGVLYNDVLYDTANDFVGMLFVFLLIIKLHFQRGIHTDNDLGKLLRDTGIITDAEAQREHKEVTEKARALLGTS